MAVLLAPDKSIRRSAYLRSKLSVSVSEQHLDGLDGPGFGISLSKGTGLLSLPFSRVGLKSNGSISYRPLTL